MLLKDEIELLSGELTASERKLAATLLADYPYAGLDTIQVLAGKTKVSAPSITRFVHKLGCHGYQEFQRRLIGELKEGRRSPVDLHPGQDPVATGFLGEFLKRTAALTASTSDGITEKQFERICGLLGDQKRSVFLLGGRMSDTIALMLSRHLRQIRRNIFHLPADPETWPEYLLRMRPKDVLFIVDFRRYQSKLGELAELAVKSRNATVILVTDKWISPVAKQAREVIAVPIESGTAWDSYVGAFALVEAMISWIAEQDWEATRARIEDWDSYRIDLEATEHDP